MCLEAHPQSARSSGGEVLQQLDDACRRDAGFFEMQSHERHFLIFNSQTWCLPVFIGSTYRRTAPPRTPFLNSPSSESTDCPGFLRGNQAEIARRLGVHRSTIHRDLKKIEMGLRGYSVEEIDMVSKSWHHSTNVATSSVPLAIPRRAGGVRLVLRLASLWEFAAVCQAFQKHVHNLV